LYLPPRKALAPEPFLGADGLATLAVSLLAGAATLGLSMAAALWRVLLVARAAPMVPGRARWAVVLGTPPGPVFQARLERARMLALAEPGLRIAVLGGATRPGAPAEAEFGTAWLRAAGVSPDRLMAEAWSRHTLENLREFRAAVPDRGGPVVLVSSRTHLARAAAMAEGLGLPVLPCAAEPALTWRELRRLPAEAFLLHWYLVGRAAAQVTRSRRMLARIT